ncbi:alpha-ketoglutarate-dependent dioxygenase alkB homolog 6 isoform X13 [Capsicum annuum]|uniref:alpha-ketoglutarate-dependent dioxygenase alkB homolog 6 isoform X13 n=1 Tax=Capsicum annuum TaxID=4072 RepID=UPI001FB10230|nr:alpha-ketoglutarate-dependent dioxygenase alkB homolog 6 isoform X13 [Capsicum annuum]
MPEKIEMAKTVNEFRVGSVPTVFYIPDFITDSQHDQLLNTIYDAPISKWKSLKNRRLQNWVALCCYPMAGGVVHEKGLIAQDLPPWLTRITRRINEKSGLFPSSINHVLINEYLPNQGIMDRKTGQTIGIGHESQGLYHLTYSNSFTACSATDPPDLIHKRLSHPSLSKLQKMVPSLSSLFTLDCESCQLGKYTRATFSRSIESRSESIFSLVHFDI